MKKKYCLFLLIFIFSIPQLCSGQTINRDTVKLKGKKLMLMPVPLETIYTAAKFRVDTGFTLSVLAKSADKLCGYSTRFLRRLAGRTGLFLKQDYISLVNIEKDAKFRIRIADLAEIKQGMDESYELSVLSGGVQLVASTDVGAMRGLETLLQLLQSDSEGYYFPGCQIKDKPRFGWRGLMIDAARHFMPIEVIKRNLDAMAAMKLNVFHWHLSEDQGFRVECKAYPKLHLLGSDGLFYTQVEIQEIVKYASERGIMVVPEFDIPGHATSWFVGYPELASGPGPYNIERNWGIFNPSFNPAIPETYEFFDKFFAEITKLFPSEYFHIGGDENSGKQWDANQDIQKFMKENNISSNHGLQTYFNTKIIDLLSKYGKKVIGWDEILQDGLPQTSIIHSWRGKKGLVEAATKGYKVILSSGYYIDLLQPTEFHYANDPVPNDSPLSNAEKEFVMGGEATMWSEHVTPETVDSRIWPRTAAIAERFWSSQAVNDTADMYQRLDVISLQMEELGILHIKNQDMLFRRLSGGYDIEPLRVLAGAVEPVEGYLRYKFAKEAGKKLVSYAPYTRFVDATTADAKEARQFRLIISKSKNGIDEKNLRELKSIFARWSNNYQHMRVIIEKNPILSEIEPLSLSLNRLATIGLEAIDYFQSGNKPTSVWVDSSIAFCTTAKKPSGEAELVICSSMIEMIDLFKKIVKYD